jgi:hypothetical protein
MEDQPDGSLSPLLRQYQLKLFLPDQPQIDHLSDRASELVRRATQAFARRAALSQRARRVPYTSSGRADALAARHAPAQPRR